MGIHLYLQQNVTNLLITGLYVRKFTSTGEWLLHCAEETFYKLLLN